MTFRGEKGEERLNEAHDSSRLEDLENFAINAFPSRGMACSLDGINSIKRVLPELLGELHKVALDELNLILKTQVLDVLGRTTDLESVVVQTDDADVGEPGDLSRGTTDAAPDVQHTHTGLETHFEGEIMLVAGERGVEGFALVEPREVERLTPGKLVQFGSAIVITYTSQKKKLAGG